MNKHDIDLTLLRKMFEAGNMTDPDIAEIMGQSNTTIRQYRVKMGYAKPDVIECNICHEKKKVNCFDKEQQGICIKCRNENGMKEVNGNGGRPKSQTKKKKHRCLRCQTVFITPLDDKGIPIIHFCEKCQKQIPYWGEPEEFYAQGARI